jgi:hypothetical protein
MTKNSPRIYTYKITFEEVPYYYYGVKKEKKYNEKYWGSPKTNKWCWEFYTPKKQILEIFDYTDDGWLKAQEIEKRLISPVYNCDKWCLNESCGGRISMNAIRQSGLYCFENKIGIHNFSTEKRREIGKRMGEKNYKNKVGIHALTREQRSNNAKKNNAQKWICLETGFVTNSGNLSQYQKARGIDTSKRKRIG